MYPTGKGIDISKFKAKKYVICFPKLQTCNFSNNPNQSHSGQSIEKSVKTKIKVGFIIIESSVKDF
jgi:hypothetical protein